MEDDPFAPGADPMAQADAAYDPGDRTPADLDPFAVLTRCWELLAEQPAMVLAGVLIPVLISLPFEGTQIALELAVEQANSDEAVLGMSLASLVVQIVGGIVGLFINLGAIRIFMNIAFGRETELMMLFSGGRHFLPALLASILIGLGTVLGFILLIIPGVIFALMMYFSLYLIVDRNLGPIEAMTESMALTDGNKITIFVVSLVIGLLVVGLSCVTLGLGALVLVPMVSLAQAVMYHSLVKQKEAYAELWG